MPTNKELEKELKNLKRRVTRMENESKTGAKKKKKRKTKKGDGYIMRGLKGTWGGIKATPGFVKDHGKAFGAVALAGIGGAVYKFGPFGKTDA